MTFLSEKTVKAVRKQVRCDACGQHIEIGQPAQRWAGVEDGQFHTLVYHPECREAEIALNALHGTFSAEWMGLYDAEPDDHPWLLAEHPVVAARKGITATSIEAHEKERAASRAAWAEVYRKRREGSKA